MRPALTDHSMPALTGLRGLCALWVLFYHAWAYAIPREIVFTLFGETFRFHVFLSLGWSGVQVLFVLSAFLLTTPYARYNAGLARKPRVGKYLLRRVARVFPAFHVQLILLLLIGWFVFGRLTVELAQLPQYFLMLFVPPPIGVGSPAHINGVWWTLPIELSFYLALPLLGWLAAWRLKWVLLLLSLGTMAVWRYYTVGVLDVEAKNLWAGQLPGSMDAFGLGMLGAVVHVHFTQPGVISPGYRRVMLALLAMTPLVFFGLGHWMAEQFDVYWGITTIFFSWTPLFNLAVTIVILNLAINQSVVSRLLGNRWIVYSGVISYGVYLWHPPAAQWLMRQPWIADFDGYQFPRLAISMFICAVVAATLSWFLVEKRAIAFTRRFK